MVCGYALSKGRFGGGSLRGLTSQVAWARLARSGKDDAIEMVARMTAIGQAGRYVADCSSKLIRQRRCKRKKLGLGVCILLNLSPQIQPSKASLRLLQGEFQISKISLCAAPRASRLTVIKSEKTDGDGECNAHLGGVDYFSTLKHCIIGLVDPLYLT